MDPEPKPQISQTQEDEISRLTAERDDFETLALLYHKGEFQEKLKSVTLIKEHAKKEAEWKKERESERRRWDKEVELKMEVVEREKREERMEWEREKKEWERKRVREEEERGKEVKARWKDKLRGVKEEGERKVEEEKRRGEERMRGVKEECDRKVEEETRRCEERIRGLNEECERKVEEEKRRGEAILEREKAERESSYAREREVWKRESDDERNRLMTKLSAMESISRSNSRMLVHTRHPPNSSISTLAPRIAKDTVIPKTEVIDNDIIDLSHDSPPAFRMEVDRSRSPEIITIEDDDDDEPAPQNPTAVSNPIQSLPPPATSTSTSSQTAALSNTISSATLSHSRRIQYLSGTTPYRDPTAPDFLPVSISRAILTKRYHSQTRGLAWVSPDNQHHFLTPSCDWNPDMPRAPGEPGLLLTTETDMIAERSPWTTFFRLDDRMVRTVRWGYAGEYVCKEVGQLTKEEFEARDVAVKNTWGGGISARLGEGTLLEMRARIGFRKYLKREPTYHEMRLEAYKIKGKTSMYAITGQDVIDAIVKGEEHIKVIQMQCVGYDHSRAKELMNAQEEHEKEEEKKKAGGNKGHAVMTMDKEVQTSNKRILVLPDGDDDKGEGGVGRAGVGADVDVNLNGAVEDDGERPSKRRRADELESGSSAAMSVDADVEAEEDDVRVGSSGSCYTAIMPVMESDSEEDEVDEMEDSEGHGGGGDVRGDANSEDEMADDEDEMEEDVEGDVNGDR